MQQLVIITAFAARVSSGYLCQGYQVQVPTITEPLLAIVNTLQLAGKQSPIHKTEGIYKILVAWLMEGYHPKDPPIIPQLAIPINVPREMQKYRKAQGCKQQQAMSNLGIIAFYYFLRVGEHTKPRYTTRNGLCNCAMHTVQFRVCNIGFFLKGSILPCSSSLKKIAQSHIVHTQNNESEKWQDGTNNPSPRH